MMMFYWMLVKFDIIVWGLADSKLKDKVDEFLVVLSINAGWWRSRCSCSFNLSKQNLR